MTTIHITQNEFKDALKRLKPFMSKEETRFYICSIYFQLKDKELTLAATNGHILCEIKLALKEATAEQNFVLAGVDVLNLLKILPKADKNEPLVLLTIDGNKLTFDTFGYQYACKALDAKYPDYQRVIPETKHTLNLPSANSQYVLAALQAIGSNKVVDIGYSDANSPFIINAENDKTTKCVIMPVRLTLSMTGEVESEAA